MSDRIDVLKTYKLAIAREEIFSPVLNVMGFRTLEEAIVRACNSPYGLASSVWRNEGFRIFRIAPHPKAGVVRMSTVDKSDPASHCGGFRDSGFGREGGLRGNVRV